MKLDFNLVEAKSKVDLYGYSAYLRLVEQRVQNDINTVVIERDEQREKKLSLAQNSNILNIGRLKLVDRNLQKLEDEVIMKKRWLEYWMEENWVVVNEISDSELYRNLSIQDLLDRFEENEQKSLKKFLIIQDAVLAPVYQPLPGFSDVKDLKERNIDKGCRQIALSFGLHPDYGTKIFKETINFKNGLENSWGNITKFGTIGVLCAGALAAILSGPIAVMIGGMMGLHGAAAFTAGLAFIGGGAISAGGLGMAGGLSILIGSGAAIGGLGGATLAAKIIDIPAPVLAIEMIKNANYAIYLADKSNISETANENLNKLLEEFLLMKHAFEKELITNRHPQKEIESMLESKKVFNYTFDYIIKRIVKGRSSL